RLIVPRLALMIIALLTTAAADAAQKGDTFTFGDVDESLLAQVNLLDRKMASDGLVYSDSVLDDYLSQLGQSLLPAGGDSPASVIWKFRALRDPLANAFALPNGSIYVTTGLLGLLQDEGQLAGVLAHEITHVADRHGYLAVRSYRKKMVAMHVISAA